jgi:hypothetical protein
MKNLERPTTRKDNGHSQIEILHPGDFYAAYILDRASDREPDVTMIIEQSRELGYPVRFWWLSQAMDLQGTSDRLILCVHHSGRNPDTGMDLYRALKDQGVTWDDLEAAAMDEYQFLGKTIHHLDEIIRPDGSQLFAK